MKFRIYIDEVGNPDLESSDNHNHRFLSLTGVIIELEYVSQKVFTEIENLKSKYFTSHPDEPIILHRKEILNAKPPFNSLEDEKNRTSFNYELLDLLKSWDYSVITVCLDKKNHKETYKVWRYDPYHYCLAILLERYILFLESVGGIGDVMAESRGGKEDKRLKESYENLFNHGTQYVESERFRNCLTSKQLKVKTKLNNISGLQIADLLAYPSRNEILYEQGLLFREPAPFSKQVIEILQLKYYHVGNRIYGKKFI